MSNKDKKIDELDIKSPGKNIPQRFTSAARNNYFIKISSIEREKNCIALRLYKKSQLHIPMLRV